MKILIATGVYPPEAGGPAQYAKSIKDEFERLGHSVTVRTFGVEQRLPTGIRHVVYFFKTFPAYLSADWTLVLDTFSVGLPVAVLRTLFGGIVVLRTGGDFLWEAYVERTKEKILLSDFYAGQRSFTTKEQIIFSLTRWVVSRMDRVVFSTTYQKDIWFHPYHLQAANVSVVENQYPERSFSESKGKTFVYCAARNLVWKNIDSAQAAFAEAQKVVPDITFETLIDVPREVALERIRDAYVCMLVSLGDISPNYILRAIACGKPVLLTAETGLRDRLTDAVLFVDPLDTKMIAEKIVWLADEKNHRSQEERARSFSFVHTYADIAKELLDLAQKYVQ